MGKNDNHSENDVILGNNEYETISKKHMLLLFLRQHSKLYDLYYQTFKLHTKHLISFL